MDTWKRALVTSEPLTREQEAAVCARIKVGDQSAREELALANLRFVLDTAAKFQGGPVPFDELVAAGNLGLMKAVDRFEPERGHKFITYAVWWIRQAIQEAIRDRRAVHRPQAALEQAAAIQRTAAHLAQDLGREPTSAEVCAASGAGEASLSAAVGECSLDAQLDGGPWVESLADNSMPDIDDAMDRDTIRQIVDDAMAALDVRRQYIVRKCFGFGSDSEARPWSLSRCSQRLGVSRERVRQLRNTALDTLRRELSRRGAAHLLPR